MTEQRINAFPYNGAFYKSPGMELRDWFAGQALVGMLSGRNPNSLFTPPEAAEKAFMIADAMLAERTRINDEEGN